MASTPSREWAIVVIGTMVIQQIPNFVANIGMIIE